MANFMKVILAPVEVRLSMNLWFNKPPILFEAGRVASRRSLGFIH